MKNEEKNTRTIEELQAEVNRLETEDTLTTKRVTLINTDNDITNIKNF